MRDADRGLGVANAGGLARQPGTGAVLPGYLKAGVPGPARDGMGRHWTGPALVSSGRRPPNVRALGGAGARRQGRDHQPLPAGRGRGG